MLVSPWGVRIYFPRGYVSYRNGSTFVRKNSAPAGTKLVPSLPQSPTQPAVFPKASRIAPRPSLRLLDASSCPTLPVRQSHSLPRHPRDAGVCRLRQQPPLRGQWPPRAGSLALRGRIVPLGLGRRPLSCSQATVRAGATGATKDRGQKNNGLTARRFLAPSFSVASRLSVTVRSQAQCLSQPIRSRNQANRLLNTHSPAGSRRPSINLF